MSNNPIPSRLANLPGYDAAAPDLYETTDSTTTQQTSPPLPSEPSETSDSESASASASDDEEGPFGILSRRRLYPDVARRRFGEESRGLGSKGVDLSDRVDGRRRGYKVRRRSGSGSPGRVVGVVGVEGLEARIARLRREVEEVRVAAQEGDGEGGDKGGEAEELGRLLAGVEVPLPKRQGARSESRTVDEGAERDDEGEEQTLRKVADFDSRLSALEQALGIASMFDPSNTNAVSTPILPTLTLLDQQLAALLSSTSLTNLEAASARISKLRSQAEALTSRPTSSSSSEPADITPEDLTKLQSLYTLLPTLQSLSPTVPALLTRLHSLRTLHAGAANAASELEDVEKRQAEMESELKAWREGLEKVEQAVGEASEANGRNGKVVEAWVRELEGRMKKLGR
jgi:nuclear migration protein JNM1